jgi:branched-chain amino acid transport system substrate-binding protein
VQELGNLYDREKVDAVVGYVGSGDCLAVAPVAEEMKKFLILYDCGTPRIFEDGKYAYVFAPRLTRRWTTSPSRCT